MGYYGGNENIILGSPIWVRNSLFLLGFESTLLARQLHQERTQMEAQ